MPFDLAKAMRLNPILVPKVRAGAPPGWPQDVGSEAFAKATFAFQSSHGLLSDGLFGKQTNAAYEASVSQPKPSPRLFFDASGLLRSSDPHVLVLHLQTRKRATRRLENGQVPISYVVNHVTAFERPLQPMTTLPSLLQTARLPSADQDRLQSELRGRTHFPGSLLQCLQNESDPDRQASWDFLAETRRDGLQSIVQYNGQMDAFYAWHAGPSKKYYSEKKAGIVVKNREGTIVWDGQKFVWPIHINAHSIGIENSFFCGPMVKEGSKIIYPFSKTARIDLTDPAKRFGDLMEAEGKVFEVAPASHMKLLADLNAALLRRYASISVERIIGHYHVDPINRAFDPVYTIPIGPLRAQVEEILAEGGV